MWLSQCWTNTDLTEVIEYLRTILSIFTVDVFELNKNRILLSIKTKGGVSYEESGNMPFFIYTDAIRHINELDKKENEESSQQTDHAKNIQNFNPGSIMNNMSRMANKFKV